MGKFSSFIDLSFHATLPASAARDKGTVVLDLIYTIMFGKDCKL